MYGPLEVLASGRAYIMVLILLARRSHDEADICVPDHDLDVSTRDQARHILDTYIPDDHI